MVARGGAACQLFRRAAGRAEEARAQSASGVCYTVAGSTCPSARTMRAMARRAGEQRRVRGDAMAAPQRRDRDMEALIRRGTAEIVRLNPHIGAPPPAFTDEEIAEIQRGDAALAALWDSPEGQRAQ